MRQQSARVKWLTDQANRYAQSPPAEWLSARGISAEVAHGFRLGKVVDPEPAHAQYEGRLAIPYVTPSGVVSVRFRCLGGHDCNGHQKYLAETGSKDHLYNVGALHERHPVIAICEGELDTITCDQIVPTVGLSGAKKWKRFYRRLFEDYERVFVIGDGDDAGKELTERVCHELENASAITLPPNEDVNSYAVKHGMDALKDLILGRHAGM